MEGRILRFLSNVWSNITIEPLVILYTLIETMSEISGEELYLQKACKVNFNHSSEICYNLHDHGDLEVEIQKFVVGVKTQSGVLQSLPVILFTLFAGPLSDHYGRKMLLIIPLFGHCILNLVYLLNSIWFYELKVEYLLFECLQDLTGGGIVFYLAVRAFVVDITEDEDRTARLAFADAVHSIGTIIGIPTETYMKKLLGFIPLFSINLLLCILTIIYSTVYVQDSYHLLPLLKKEVFDEERKKGEKHHKEGIINGTFTMVMNMFRNVFQRRSNNEHVLLLLFTLIIFSISFMTSGYDVIGLMFYKLHYKMTSESYGNLITVWMVSMFIGQMFLVPFLSKTMKLRDTSILIIGLVPAAFSLIAEGVFTQVWILFLLAAIFYPLLYNIVTTSKSAMSKILGPTEVGKAFGLLGIFEALLVILSKMFFGVLYQATLGICPELFLYVSSAFVFLALIFAVSIHLRMKRGDKEVPAVTIDSSICKDEDS